MENLGNVPRVTKIDVVLDSLIDYLDDNLEANQQKHKIVPTVCSIRPRYLAERMGFQKSSARYNQSSWIGTYLLIILNQAGADYELKNASRGNKVRIHNPKQVLERLKSIKGSQDLIEYKHAPVV